MNFRLSKFFSSDIGIDLGTANCLVYVKDRGVVLSEPSVVAIKDNVVVSVGAEAKRMLGRCPMNIKAIRPMKAGVIADFAVTEEMLRYFIMKAKNFMAPYQRIFRPTVLIAVPSGITEVESRAVQDSAMHAGAAKVQRFFFRLNAFEGRLDVFPVDGDHPDERIDDHLSREIVILF